jgi:hypothetical protein
VHHHQNQAFFTIETLNSLQGLPTLLTQSS